MRWKFISEIKSYQFDENSIIKWWKLIKVNKIYHWLEIWTISWKLIYMIKGSQFDINRHCDQNLSLWLKLIKLIILMKTDWKFISVFIVHHCDENLSWWYIFLDMMKLRCHINEISLLEWKFTSAVKIRLFGQNSSLWWKFIAGMKVYHCD